MPSSGERWTERGIRPQEERPSFDYMGTRTPWPLSSLVRRILGRRPSQDRQISPEMEGLVAHALRGNADLTISGGEVAVESLTDLHHRLLDEIREADAVLDPMPERLGRLPFPYVPIPEADQLMPEDHGGSERSEDAQEPDGPPGRPRSDTRSEMVYTHKAVEGTTPVRTLCGVDAPLAGGVAGLAMHWRRVSCPDCLRMNQDAGDPAGSDTRPEDAQDPREVVHFWDPKGGRSRWLHDLPVGAYKTTRNARDVTCDRCLSELGLRIMSGDFGFVVQEPEHEVRLSDLEPPKTLRPEDVPWKLELVDDQDRAVEDEVATARPLYEVEGWHMHHGDRTPPVPLLPSHCNCERDSSTAYRVLVLTPAELAKVRDYSENGGVRLAARLLRDHWFSPEADRCAKFLEARADRVLP